MKQILHSIPVLPPRKKTGHKGLYGTVALLGGSLGMSGAIELAGEAALKAGAGLVRLLVPRSIHPTAASFRPEYTVFPISSDNKGRFSLTGLFRIETLLSGASAIGVGPGLGRSLGLDIIATRLFFSSELPVVFDADALNALAYRDVFNPNQNRCFLGGMQSSVIRGPRIFTPHPGEFFRMSQKRVGSDQDERIEAAVHFIRELRKKYSDSPPLVLALKGAGTVVTDGDRVFVNKTGNPGMGTGGAGDVLTGIIAALTAQGLPCFEAAVSGVHIHGTAGDLAAKSKGEISLTSADLLDFLPAAFQTENKS